MDLSLQIYVKEQRLFVIIERQFGHIRQLNVSCGFLLLHKHTAKQMRGDPFLNSKSSLSAWIPWLRVHVKLLEAGMNSFEYIVTFKRIHFDCPEMST